MLNALRVAAAVLCLSLVGAPVAKAQPAPDADRLAAAKELLVVTNAEKQFAIVVPMIFNQLRQTMPAVKDQAAANQIFDEIQKQAVARSSEIIDKIAVIYAQKFTAEEMKAVATFYRTPAGQKFIGAQGELAAEGMKLGNEWGREVAGDAVKKIREEMQKRNVQ